MVLKKKKKDPHPNLKKDTKECIYKENKVMVTKGEGEEG